MGFCIAYGKVLDDIVGFKKKGNIYYKIKQKKTPAPLVYNISNDTLVIAIGDIFNKEIKDIVNDKWEQEPKILLDVLGEFCFVKVDFDDNIYFASSQAGIENLYYYNKNGIFIITDDFWEAINLIEPNYEDINKQALYESLTYFYPLDYETEIDGLKWLPPSTIAFWSKETKKITLNKYWDFAYRVDQNLDIEKAVDNLDKKLDTAMKLIKKKCGNIEYAVGLSGGLDSRIIPYYALKNSMNLKAFIISEKYPKTFLISRDYKSARKIARYFNLDLIELPTDLDSLKDQVENDVRTYPLGPSAVAKQANSGLPSFDVLLTGGNGLVVGSVLPENISTQTMAELYETITDLSYNAKNTVFFKNRAARALKYLFKIPLNLTSNKEFNVKFVPDSALDIMNEKWKRIIQIKKEKGYSNLDIYEDYFNNYIGFRNRLGAFESICGTKRSFSIYIPFVFNETLRWKEEFLQDRLVLKTLIKKIMPEIAVVNGQSYEVSYGKKGPGIVKKMVSMFDYIIRGTGTGILNTRKGKLEFKREFYNITNCDTQWFFSIVPKDEYVKAFKFKDDRLVRLLMKKKRLFDVIEKKEYKKYL